MTFVRTAIGPNTRPGLEFVRIAMKAGKAGAALVRTRAPFTLLPRNAGIADVTNFSDPVVLMRAPYRVIFAYAGPDRIWRNTWRNADELPAAVRVTVRDAATERGWRSRPPRSCTSTRRPNACAPNRCAIASIRRKG